MKWRVERRIAMEPDYEFVLYSNETLTTGGLRIAPKLTEQFFGSNQLRKDLIVQECTGPKNSMSCFYKRSIQHDLAPPVVSSQLTTSGRFSFLYGRVQIEAKLPTGDWIYPQLWLQPQGNAYDNTDYRSGLIVVGSMKRNGTESVVVEQGVILGAEEPVRSLCLKQIVKPISWAKDFHKYVVDWTPSERTIGI